MIDTSRRAVIEQIAKIEGVDLDDAREIFADMREEIASAIEYGDYSLVEEIMAGEGFEPDYIFAFI